MLFPEHFLAVRATVEAGREDEFNRWYWQEHLPALLAVPGYRAGRRYVAVDGEPRYLALWEIDSIDAYFSPEHDRAVETPWTARIKQHNASKMDFYRQINPNRGLLRGPSYGDGSTRAGGLMVFRMDVAPEHETEFNAWYDDIHIPDLLRVPGIVSAKRSTLAEPQTMMQGENIVMANARMIEAKYKYLAIYRIEADDPAAVLQDVVSRARTPAMEISPSFAEAYTILFEDLSDQV